MSNKTQLQTNNTALDALITRVNAAKDTAASLPEAGGSGGAETCTVTMVQEWGGNDDPALCIVYVLAYNLETSSIIKETMDSSYDMLSSHSITFKAYKNYPIIVKIYRCYSPYEPTITVNGGSILCSESLEYESDNIIHYWCMPTSDNATFTFSSP